MCWFSAEKLCDSGPGNNHIDYILRYGPWDEVWKLWLEKMDMYKLSMWKTSSAIYVSSTTGLARVLAELNIFFFGKQV